ncbi:chemotaxis-specific protein-glutamate methyltransferase CheB [Halostella litorea]|uniref:chemotaxis-specific protein-glutamate methyltransferase CheB n=1 Tax=Halostella litorea TaxID=2528831 RepID=UPI001092B49A|nr:chemotaxis-specific protein-glutamate methyltransferase CheB [Halostella litorea]
MTSVLVVDDSEFVRTVIGNALSDHGYEVREASDGESAVRAVAEHDPDLVTMDVVMPGMDGIEAVDRIMSANPTRILMLSAHTEAGADATLEALSKGAVDFLAKSGETVPGDAGTLAERVVEKLRAVERVDLSSVIAQRAADRAAAAAQQTAAAASGGTATVDAPAVDGPTVEPTAEPTASPPTVDGDLSAELAGDRPATPPTVVVGASTGGPKVVERILRELPADLDARVLVVQHMPASFTGRLAARLDDLSTYDVREAAHGDVVGPGEAVVAKGEYHMRVVPTDGDDLQLQLTEEKRRHGVRPAIDVTMESAADAVDDGLVGVALTGMGRDGAAGIEAIHAAGGTTIAQDEASSPVFGIPRKAIETGAVDAVLDARSMAAGIVDAATADGDTDG